MSDTHEIPKPPWPDDESTERTPPRSSRAAPKYHTPVSLPIQPSPFHHVTRIATVPGMAPGPKIASRTATTPGMPAAPAAVVTIVPRVVGAPELDLDGPTDPEGHDIPSSGELDLAPLPHLEGPPTDPAIALPKPQVPPPDAPKILVSHSLELEAAQKPFIPVIQEPRKHLRAPPVPQEGPGPHVPTELALPALKRRVLGDSEWPLILGLVLLAFMILGLAGAVVYGVAGAVDERAAPPPAKTGAGP